MKKANILIVEDDNTTANLIELLLASHGHNVCGVVTSGEKAVDITIKTKPDIVVMDIKLNGEVDGITACERIKKHLSVPVIFVSAFTEKELIDRALECNPSGYIVKPFKNKDLLSKIESVLEYQRIDSEE